MQYIHVSATSVHLKSQYMCEAPESAQCEPIIHCDVKQDSLEDENFEIFHLGN